MTGNSKAEYARITMNVKPERKKELKKKAEERDMSLAAYIRSMTLAGERQLYAIEENGAGNDREAVRSKLLEQLPEDEEDAVHQEELIDEVTEPIEDLAHEILRDEQRIKHSPRYEGYYQT